MNTATVSRDAGRSDDRRSWVTVTVKEALPVEPTQPEGLTWPAGYTHFYAPFDRARAVTAFQRLRAQGYTVTLAVVRR